MRQVPSGSLEDLCRRAALLAGAVKSHAGAGLGLKPDGGMANDLGEDQRCDGKGEITVARLPDDCRVGGAVLRYCREIDSAGG